MSVVSVFKGRTHGEDVVEGRQEDRASSGVEKNASGPQSHSWTSAAGRGESPGSSGPGKGSAMALRRDVLLGVERSSLTEGSC